MNQTLQKLSRLQKITAVIAIVGLSFCCLGLVWDRHVFYVSYLFAFVFWAGLSFGCFYAAMIHYLTGGRWGFPARRFFEAGFMTLPVMAVLLIPIFFGVHELYPWAQPDIVAADKALQQRSSYENFTAFLARAVVFFNIWIFIAARLRIWSLRQDFTQDAAPTIKIRALSGPAIAIVPLTTSFAFIDWAMSIETNWYSTIFPVIILAGQLLTAFAFVTVVLAWIGNEILSDEQAGKMFHDLGNFLLAFVMFWTYVAFSQVIIIYSTNLPHEISWYLRRISGGWLVLVAFVALFHFFAPFFLLLFRTVKKNVRTLAVIALLLFIVHALAMYWVVAPTFYPQIHVHWTAFAAWFGIGGLWLTVFLENLKTHPLLARNDPRAPKPIAQTADAK
ncbi:MAG TPA: hypothetical protein VGN23_11350 [Verrucomicrobiae bacterium]|jgi:hypothetical protein